MDCLILPHHLLIMKYTDLIELSMDELRQIQRHYAIKPCKTKRRLAELINRFIRIHNIENIQSITDCAICMETIDERYKIITDCNHAFCDICMTEYIKTSLQCPMCRKSYKYTNIVNQMSAARMIEIEDLIKNNKHKNKIQNPTYNCFDLCIATTLVICVCIIELVFLLVIIYTVVSTVTDFYTNEILKKAQI